MRVLTIILTVALLLASAAAYADPPTQVTGSEIVVRNGVTGIWWPMDTATRMLTDLQSLPLLREQVHLLELKLELRQETIDLYKANMDITQQQADRWHAALLEALRVETPHQSFWDSRELWFGLGAAATAVMAIGLSFGMGAAN